MTRRRLFAGAAAIGYSKLVVTLSQLVTVPVLSHAWGLPLYGQWILLSTVPTFLAAGDFGFGNVAANRIIGQIAQNRQEAALATFQSGLAIVLLLSGLLLALVCGAILALPGSILRVAGGLPVGDVRLALILLAIGGIVSIQRGLFQGASRAVGQFARSTAIETSFALAETIAIVAIAVLGGTPVVAAAAFLTARICSTLALALFARRQAPWLRIGLRRAELSQIREMTRPSLAVMLYPLANAGLLQGTALAVGMAGGAALVPVYTALRTLARTGLQVLQAISLPVAPEYAAAQARGDTAHAAGLGGMLATLSIAGSLAFAALLALFGQAVLQAWTKGAIAAPPAAILIFAASVAFGGVWPQLANLLFALNRHESFTVRFAAAVLPILPLTYVLVRQMGVTGGAIAYFLADAAATIAVYCSLRRQGMWPRIGAGPVLAIWDGRHDRPAR